MKKKNHLSDTERKTIENLLNEGCNIKIISDTISRSISTVSREIEKHKQILFPSCFNKSNPCLKYNDCIYRFFDCFKTCAKAEFKKCEKLNSAPHICNSCETQKYCRCGASIDIGTQNFTHHDIIYITCERSCVSWEGQIRNMMKIIKRILLSL